MLPTAAASNLCCATTKPFFHGPFKRICQYDRVKVVPVYWEGENVFEDEATDVARCFEKLGWEAEMCAIKEDGMCTQLLHMITGFDVERALLVLYYTGHGVKSKAPDSCPVPARDAVGSVTMNWGMVQNCLLGGVKVDVLVVADACQMDFTGWIRSQDVNAGRNVDVLVSGGKNSEPPISGKYCFRRAFLKELERTVDKGPMTPEQMCLNIEQANETHLTPRWKRILGSGEDPICLEAYPTQATTSEITIQLTVLKWAIENDMKFKSKRLSQWLGDCPLSSASISVSGFETTHSVDLETSGKRPQTQRRPAVGNSLLEEEVAGPSNSHTVVSESTLEVVDGNQQLEAAALHHARLAEFAGLSPSTVLLLLLKAGKAQSPKVLRHVCTLLMSWTSTPSDLRLASYTGTKRFKSRRVKEYWDKFIGKSSGNEGVNRKSQGSISL